MKVTRNENGSKPVRISASYRQTRRRTNTLNGIEFLNRTRSRKCAKSYTRQTLRSSNKVDEAALKDLIRAAVALNLRGKSKPKPRRASSKRAD